MRTKGAASNNKGPKPPTRPKTRSLAQTAKNSLIIPYLIDGDPTLGLLDENNVYVALGRLRFRSYESYENIYDESIDISVSRVLYVLQTVTRRNEETLELLRKKEAGELNDEQVREAFEALPKIEYDEIGRIKTPYGVMYGSLERNMINLAAFILAQYGQIVADNGDGTYEYERITADEIKDYLGDPSVVFKVDEEDNASLFLEILEVSGVWSPPKVVEDLVSNGEIEDDELKNSVSSNTASE